MAILHLGRAADGQSFYYVMKLADPAEPAPTRSGRDVFIASERAEDNPPYLPRTLRHDLRNRVRLPAALQKDRENGQRRASLDDFHSFRVTWITLAFAAGVPLELVQRVTGHRTVAVVLKHHFRPGREDFRQVLLKAMPKMLGEASPAPTRDEIRQILADMTARTWRADRARLLSLLAH